MENKIRNFTDLIAYQNAHKLVLETYAITKRFPAEERFCLTDQMRRSAISITSNIAEGFSRKTARDKSQFYAIAKGSLTELQSQMLTARDLGYIAEKEWRNLEDCFAKTAKLLSGLIKSAQSYL